MATISENLQILKNSTDAIKQAIIDKGGIIEGDITTWASAISGISGGGSSSSEEEITFTGSLEASFGMWNIDGRLNRLPDDCLGAYYIYIVGYHITEGFNIPFIGYYNAPDLWIADNLEFNSGVIFGGTSEDVVVIAITLMWQDNSGVWKNTLVKPIIQYV